MRIRTATEEDYNKIYDLVKTAFMTAQVSDGKEQEFVNELRKREGYIPKLELVMEEDGELTGHIMLTQISIRTDDGEKAALLVAPLCVREEFRNQGFGGALMREGLTKAVEMGYQSTFLVGNPDYYVRFGFKQINDYGIKNESGIPNEFVLGCEIIPGSLRKLKGGVIGKLD